MAKAGSEGEIFRVAGPVVTATGLQPRMYDVMFAGEEELMGEVIGLAGDRTIIQVYEETSGLRPGEKVVASGQPLVVELGPGLLGSIYDGVQRPLPTLADRMGDYILRGVRANALDRTKEWAFEPKLKKGDELAGGQVIGTVPEAEHVEHRVLAPPNVQGTIKEVREGTVNVEDIVVSLSDGVDLRPMQTWPVRRGRPVRERLTPSIPLITGQRVFDFFFPLAKGGTAAIPGGFGTGKCVVGSTPVSLADRTNVPIREIYESFSADAPSDGPEHFVPLREPLPIFTFDGYGIQRGRASAVYRGGTEWLTEVRLRSGRRVRLTPFHRLFRFTERGVAETPAAHLRPGDGVIAPRDVSAVSDESRDLHTLMPEVEGGRPLNGRLLERGGIVADPVESVETWQESASVYDLTVDRTHNFVGGDLPMILHNTVSGHQLSRWSDAKVVLYIGCGERGNEMTEVLRDFPELVDPYTGAPLMERTVLVANTSNMPVAAREASVYTGVTVAEYYRDMGYHILLMADSTSRWAEAMREISSRLEEMPGEEGFPAYLSARLSEFYERAGRATTLSGEEGSISVVGAVSPAGGDFSEPVTQGTLRITKVFWALDTKLKERRHFPSINWLTSYSLYAPSLEDWFRQNVNDAWPAIRSWAYRVLQEEAELEEIVRLVGADALPEDQQLTLEVARMIREYFLQQNAFHDVDTYFTLERQFALIQAIHRFSELGQRAQRLEVPLREIVNLPSRALLSRVKYEEGFEKELESTVKLMEEEFRALEAS